MQKSKPNQSTTQMQPKTVRQIIVNLLKSTEGQQMIDDLSKQIPELATLKFKGIK